MKNSIVFKTSLIIVSVLVVIMSIIGFSIYKSQSNIIDELQLNQKKYITAGLDSREKASIKKELDVLNTLISSIKGAISDSIYNLDPEGSRLILQEFLQKDSIKAVYIFDSSAKDTFLVGYKEDNKIVIANDLPTSFIKLDSIRTDFFVKDEYMGYMKVYYNNEKIIQFIAKIKEKDLKLFKEQSLLIKQKVDKEFVYQSISFMIGVLILILIIIFLLKKFVNTPLKLVKESLDDFFDFLQNKTDNVNQIDLNSSDEFGIMAKSINENIIVSAKLHEEIFELNTNLEHKIDIRTQELKQVNHEISKSIEFSSLIQKTFNQKNKEIDCFFDDYFVVLEQTGTVGGDIVLFEKLNKDECLFFIIDCTSHGVPGAFVTMIVKTLQRQIIKELDLDISPAKILSIFNFEIKELLNQNSKNSQSNVGFDGQILYYNKKENLVKFSSARSDVLIYQNQELKRYRGDRHSVGYKDSDIEFKFKEHTLNIDDDISIYMYSDGYTDQIGGDERLIPYGTKKLLKEIQSIQSSSMIQQRDILFDTLGSYRKNNIQNDDISFVGFKIKNKGVDFEE